MITPLAVPRVDFAQVQARLGRLWDPLERGSMIGVFGTTGSGKSWLVRYGLLPLCETARVVILDIKADRDSVWDGCGVEVDQLPAVFGSNVTRPREAWVRLVINRSNAKTQLRRALDQIRDEGCAVVVLDESRSITDANQEIGLGPRVERLIYEGRSSGVSMIVGAQSPAWAASAVRDQPGALFLGKQRYAKQARELANIAGHGAALSEAIRRVPDRSFIYSDGWENGILGLTSPPAAGTPLDRTPR